MDKQEMIAWLKARGMLEKGDTQLVNWQLEEKIEMALDMGIPTLDEVEEMEVVKAIKKNVKAKSKPKAKPKAKKAKKE